jgi:thioredoxin
MKFNPYYSFTAALISAMVFFACQQGTGQTGNAGGNSVFPSSADAPAFNTLMQAHPEAQLVDVRTPGEFQGGYIQGAMNCDINGNDYSRQIGALDKSKPVLVYCLSGGRSARAGAEFRKMGFTAVTELQGGVLAWKNSGLPLVVAGKKGSGMSIEEFQQQLGTGHVLVDFYAPWCAPCQRMKPSIAEIEKEQEGKLTVIRINVDENKTLAEHYRIAVLPTLMTFRSGKTVWTLEGFADKKTIVEGLSK